MKLEDRYQGSLLGLAIGDALGTTLEFKYPGTFEPIDDMVSGGPFGLEPGQWTDDTSMALCLAESLISCEGFTPLDQMERYRRWYREGYLNSTGTCFDIGNTVRGAVHTFERTGEPYAGPTDPRSAGNGSIMCVAPVPLFYAQHPQKAIEYARSSSRTTHGTQAALDACDYLAGLIIGALEGCGKDQLLSPFFSPTADGGKNGRYCTEIDAVAAGSFKEKQPPEILGSGYVVESLEAALWAFYRSDSFEEGALLAVNLGDDADTTGAVYGQLAGAFYGIEGIPHDWLEKVTRRNFIEDLADQLLKAAKTYAEEDPVSTPPEAPPLPFDRSYWVQPGRLLAGYYPGAPSKSEAEQKLHALLDSGVRCVVNLVEEEETGQGNQPLRSYSNLLKKLAAKRHTHVTYVRIPVPDVDIPTTETMRIILDAIDAAVGQDQPVYVHCWGGRGRTGTVVGCYLARHGIALGEDALERISHLRCDKATANKASPETESQCAMVRKWEKGQ